LNINKQIDYWIEGAGNDFDTARLLIENGKVLHGLFFCHLVIEKAIKANVVRITGEIPPKSHNLIYLSEKAEIVFAEDDELFVGVLMKYQLEGRYPDYQPEIPSVSVSFDYLQKTKKILLWLQNQL
jgi:HEPN domain-containing protein